MSMELTDQPEEKKQEEMHPDLTGARNRAKATASLNVQGEWTIIKGLIDNPYLKDPIDAARTRNRCAGFIYSNKDGKFPSFRACTLAELCDPDTRSLLVQVGISQALIDRALEMFPENVVAFNRATPPDAFQPKEGELREQRRQLQQSQHKPTP